MKTASSALPENLDSFKSFLEAVAAVLNESSINMPFEVTLSIFAVIETSLPKYQKALASFFAKKSVFSFLESSTTASDGFIMRCDFPSSGEGGGTFSA